MFSAVLAQSPAFPEITFPVYQNGQLLAYPFTGGVNAPQIMHADLNQDGAPDLVIFDRSGNLVLTFINNLTGGTEAYHYAPQYAKTFPPVQDYMLLRDYNQDGAMDIFCAPLEEGIQEMQVFRGYYEQQTLRFTPVSFSYPGCSICSPYHIYYPDQTPGVWNNFPIAPSDYPAVDDVDNDGDLDIIAFSAGNSVYLSWLKNTSVELGYGTDSLKFVLQDRCWGKFFENGVAKCKVKLSTTPDECAQPLTGEGAEDREERHPGATVLTFDADGDGDRDAILGNISFNCLNFLHNGGTPQNAWMTAQDTFFPQNDVPVDMVSFPASYYLDINNDNVKDLLVAPNSPTLHEDRNNIWWYKNTGGSAVNFVLQNKKLFTKDMIDLGTATHVAIADVNADGLPDLVAGTYGHYSPPQNGNPAWFTNARLYLFLNTGTATQPAFTLSDEDWLGMSHYAPNDYDFAPAFGDLDGDGDLDLLVGSNLGALYCFMNQAPSGGAMNLMEDIQAMWGSMDVGQVSTPCIYDLDGDGLNDVLMGERNGNINFYKNTGSATEPVFQPDENSAPNIPNLGAINTQVIPNGIGFSSPQIARLNGAPILVCGTQDGHFEAYQINGPTNTAYPEISLKYGNIDVGRRSTPAFGDLNHDGTLELLAGNQRGGLSLFSTTLASWQAPVGVTEVPDELAFEVTPNPASDQLNLLVPGTQDEAVNWFLYDIMGRRVLSGTGFSPVQITLPDGLPAGLYAVQVRRAGAQNSKKVWIK